MIARYRGEHHARGIWQPRRPSSPLPVPSDPAAPEPTVELGQDGSLVEPDEPPAAGPRVMRAVVVLVVVGLAASLLGQRLSGGPPAPSGLPETPRQWVDAYEAAALDDPARVCSELFSPQLAASYGRELHTSCVGYFARIHSTSLRIREIYQDGDAAVVQMHQTLQRLNWAAVLDRHRAGWRAVELIAIG